MICYKCQLTISDGVTCYSCSKQFHYECGGTTETTFRKANNEKRRTWRCPTCKTSPQLTVTPTSSIEDVMIGIKKISSELASLKTLNSQVKEDMSELKKSVEYNNSKLNEFAKRFESFEQAMSKIDRLEDDVSSLKSTIKSIQDDSNFKLNEELEKRITEIERDQERRNREYNNTYLEFRGIPEFKEETTQSLKDIIFNVSKLVKCDLNSNNIENIYRVTPRNKNIHPTVKPRTVKIRFNSTALKEQLHNAIKTYNRSCEQNSDKLNNVIIGLPGPRSPIYVSEYLTLRAKRLWYLARQFAAECKYKYVWSKAGLIFIKKDDNSRPFLIDSELALSKL